MVLHRSLKAKYNTSLESYMMRYVIFFKKSIGALREQKKKCVHVLKDCVLAKRSGNVLKQM